MTSRVVSKLDQCWHCSIEHRGSRSNHLGMNKSSVMLALLGLGAASSLACEEAEVEGQLSVLDEVDEDLSVFTQEELDAMTEVEEPLHDRFRVTYGVPAGSARKEVVWLSTLGCSGVTLSERYILTAAHCVDDQLGFPGTRRGSIGNISVRYSSTGTSPTTVYTGPASASVPFNYLLQHSDPGNWSEHDIALIQLGGDASNYVRARWHSLPAEPSVIQHEVVGWGNHGEWADSPSGSGNVRMLGLMNSHGWDNNQGINLVGGSVPDPGDSGGGSFIKPGYSTRVLVGINAALVWDWWNAGMDASRVSTHAVWAITESAVMGRPLSCHSSSVAGVPYYYGCSD